MDLIKKDFFVKIRYHLELKEEKLLLGFPSLWKQILFWEENLFLKL